MIGFSPSPFHLCVKDMNRRRFLSIVSLGTIATATTGFSFWGLEVGQNSDSLHRKLLQQLQSLESPCLSDVDSLGQAYLRDNPSEEDVDFLSQSVACTCCRCKENGELNAAHLRDQIRSDFEHSRTERVDGWILSRTEARLYALSFIS